MKLSTLIILILGCMSQINFAQNLHEPENKTIRITSLAKPDKGPEDLDVIFATKGIYHFELDKKLKVPTGYLLVITDPMNGLEISLSDSEPYYFTISRPVFKRLKMCLRKNEETIETTPTLVMN